MRGVIFPLRRVISPAISVGHFEGRPDGTESALASRLKPVVASLRGLWALGTRSDEGAVSVAYGGNWPSVPVPSITTNTRFGSAARHALLAVVSKVAPCSGVFLIWSPRPGAHRRAFFYFGREGRVFLVLSHWTCTMSSIIRLR